MKKRFMLLIMLMCMFTLMLPGTINADADTINYVVDTAAETIEFTVTGTDPEQTDELAEIQLFLAEYGENGILKSVQLGVKSDIVNGAINITAGLPKEDNYKYMLWDKNNMPLIDAIDNIDIEEPPIDTLAPTPDVTQTLEPTQAPFQTLAPGEQIKIMPLGDSITNGFTVAGAYRNKLGELLVENKLSQYVDFVGSQKTGTGYDNDNEGHSGWAIAAVPKDGDIEGKGRYGLTTNIDSWMTTYTPDIVLLQIGTNDILSIYDLDNAPKRLETLVDKILAKLPANGKLYIAKIPYIAQNANYNKTGKNQAELDEIVDTYNAAVTALAEEKGLTLVDINGVLELSDLQDGIHPNTNGYAKMGNLWYNTLEEEIRMRAGIQS